MERKGHHAHEKQNKVSHTVKETVGKVETHFLQGFQQFSHSSSSHSHQESSSHGHHASGGLHVTGHISAAEGHHGVTHIHGAVGQHKAVCHQEKANETIKVTGHIGGAEGHHATPHIHGAVGHHEAVCHQETADEPIKVTAHIGGAEGHHATPHIHGAVGHHKAVCHQEKADEPIKVTAPIGAVEVHHAITHVHGSVVHHDTPHIHGAVGHHKTVCHQEKADEPIKVTSQIGGADGHHATTQINGAVGHHTTPHIHGAVGHHKAVCHQGKADEQIKVTGHIGGAEVHQAITHIHGSVGHHATSHIHGSVGHHKAVCHQDKDTEPIKVTPSTGDFSVSLTKEKMGIYQALQKNLLSEEVALALLEAQAATGHIIDPLNNQKLTVEAAIQQGIVGPEYQQKLLLANSAATGYKYKEETISLFQAFKKGLVEKKDAVRFLQAQIATGGIINYVTGSRVPISEALKLNYIDESLFKTLTGPSELSSCYADPNTKEGSSFQELLSKSFTDSETGLVLLPLQESLQGLRKSVNLEQLFKANIITQVQYDEIREGKQTIHKLGELQEVRQYLNGLPSLGGVHVESTKEKISIYQALKRNFLPIDYAVALLEAQAASGFIIDPEKKKTFTVTEAVQEGVVGFDLKEKLLIAERAVIGFNDLYTGKNISLFQAIKKELIDRNLGLNLLQVQLATGGIIDPFHSFHVPLETAYKRGLLDEDTAQLLSINRGFLDPNTNDWVTYQELRSRATFDPDSNAYFFPLKLAFHGIRGKVTSNELLNSNIIDQATFESLQQGKLSVQDVAEQESVKRYLQGTGLIAGVADISANKIISIYQAFKEHLLMPGTSIALLEAQAATGYLIDPVKNLKFSVHDAVKNGLLGPELYEKLLFAEKAATGYKDPSSGEKLSLFQAIKRGFVTKDHGIHLLNAQLATGGIIDPSKKHRVPVEVAYARGHFDEDTNKVLLTQTNDIKGFFDPNLKENVTYEQLLERSVIDVHSGLYLTPVFDNTQDAQKTAHSFIDYKTKVILDGIKLTLTFGKFKGHLVSLWQILFSEYFSFELRQSFINLYKAGSLSVEELSKKVEAEIKQVVSSTKVTFKGLRESITPGQLLESEIIDKNLFDKLQQGEASAKDVGSIDTVKKYLQGTGSIGGLILADTQEKISIYQAKRKGFLRPGTSLILLEAQAATGYIIDPVKNKQYSVEDALKANIIGPEYYEKLLSAEKSVTGYKDPYTGERVSLFQAMNKGLIVKEHGVRLLEAQIGTGGIIDPINSLRIPVEVAYKRGYFDKKMNLILSDPSDDTKGFFDPNTHENLTYLQLKEKCITEPSTNLCLLPLVSKQQQFNINDHIRNSFRNVDIYVRYGRFHGQTVNAWFLINSEYFSEWRRRELLEQFRLKKLTLEQIIIIIEEEIKKWTEIRVPTLRGQVNIHELLEYEIIEKELFEQILEGKVTVEDVFKIDTVKKSLQGSGVLGGVIIQPSNQKFSFYEAIKNKMLLPSTILPLLEAQAATGHIVDPVSNLKLSVDEALKAAVVDPQFYERLAYAEEAVTGYTDPFSGKKISLFQAMKRGFIEEKHAKQLLEAQLATGGVIDPIHGFHLKDSVAKKHGYINEELLKDLSHPTDDIKTFYDPTTKEKVTYSELLSRSQKDESTGLHLLPLPQDFAEVPVINLYSDEEVRQLLKTARIEERNITVWELIHSGYFTEEQQFEILEKFRAKKLSLQELTTEILQIVRIHEIKRTTHINFQGLRGPVPVVWLLDLGIITQKTFDELVQGLKSVEEISQLAEVKKSLEGTGSISGVFLPSTKEKLSIYQALEKKLLLPANAIRLLEAQAATGFIINPVKNEKYTVDSAVKTGVVGPELHEKLLTAESAVSGYTDPYTGNKISLGQAIQKKLISEKEGVPLLQAQLAAGGIIDPLHCNFVPIQLAYKLGFLDEEISKQTADLKVYVDPNTKEKVSYEQLKQRCYTDPETGSLLLALSETAAFYAEGHFIDVFKSFTVTVNAGRFKGQTVSLWELLNSEYVSADKLKEILFKYKTSSSEALQEIIKTVTTIFEETEATSTQIKFKGLRRQVSASDLFQSDVIDKKTLDELNLGKKTIDEVTEMDAVKRYLVGTNSIAGVLLQATNKKMSIYEAMLKGILRPGTALVLLEAQAATGFIIDPVKNAKLSVEEAFAQGLIGSEVHAKLLSAEQAVTGYKDPFSGEKISLFQAMQKNLIVETHGVRLLEAQIATGGIIDPVHSHRVPVEVAYKRGYFDEEMNKILSDPNDDTKGFFDPNTHENLTYLQLVERCIQDPETGLYLLQVVKRGENYFYITDKMKADLQSRTIRLQFGRYANQTVSIWEILTSHYITDLKRRELVRLYILGVLTVEQLISSITTVIEEYEFSSSSLKLKGIRGEVSATDLFNADIIDRKTLSDLKEGKISVEAVSELDSVRRYLKGTSCIAGVLSLPTNETLSIYEAVSRGILSRDIGLILLQAQAATGHLIDPIKNQVLSLPNAVSQGLVNSDVQEQLEIAEKAVTGYTDKESGKIISLFQAIKKEIVPKGLGISLLDVQLATGGVVDPVLSHRIPLHIAYQRAYLDEDFYLLISDSGKKEFVDPNTHERITYKNLLERCVKDKKTGLYLLPLTEKRDDYFYIDEPTKKLLQETTVKMNSGKFKGQDISLWELLSSTYISEEQRKQILKLYKTKISSGLKDIVSVITSVIEENDKGQNDIWFQGLRKQVTAAELFDAEIINQETLDGLKKDLQTVNEVAKIDSIRRYLEGTSCIAGVLIPSKLDPTKKEKVNIYDAMLRRVLRPGTALVLLEAQAATGFVIDSIQNRRLSVDEALSAGVIGYEIYEKLLSAERGVTGYNDPYTGEKMSLFQAMQKDIIVKEHGIRLLEAQIATGGIIDPVHSHRVPVEVAYKRGYFNEELNQILSDPTDDTKGFFDPNTHENLTYLQLLQRCVKDPDTGLYMLELKDSKFSPTQVQNKLQSSFIQIAIGEFQGKSVSIWELFNSKYFTAERREELLKKFEAGTLTIEEILAITIKVVNEKEQILSQASTTVSQADTTDSAEQVAKTQTWLQSEKVNVSVGDFKGQSISVWELLNSRYISGEKRKEILERIQSGTLTVQEIITILITIITETETTKVVQKSVAVPDGKPVELDHSVQDDEIEKALQNISIPVTKGQYAGQEVSVWDLLNSKYIPEDTKQEFIEEYKLTVQDIMELVVHSIRVDQSRFKTEYNLKVEVYNVVQTVQIEVTEGEFKGQHLSVWYLLNSKYFSEEKRRELLEKFNSGTLSIDELIKIITTTITETEEHSKKLKFKGLRRQITASELLTSEIIDQTTLRELAQGQKTVEEVTQMDSVKRYLVGTSCLAGVLVPSLKDPSKSDKMSIYDAMLKNILRPGTALVLLEAQAATGFIIDPVSNKKLSVDEAAAAGLIGHELHAKLLSAERAVTGYKDPYTGDKISLFQAMQKDLIVKDHGIRLLEAQIATGGIIDPVHSHRVPVEVAYKRGFFNEEMNQILSDPSDDTKGFFDPNTHENLTYLQLLSRCVQEPDTGLYMLTMKDKQAILAEKTFETSLQSLTIQVKVGQYQGQTPSSWELLHSKYFTEEKRQLLLNKYKSKTITVEELISGIQSAIEEWEQRSSSQTVDGASLQVAVQDITEEIKRDVTIEKKEVYDIGFVPKLKQYVEPDTDEDHKALTVFTVHVQAEEFQSKRVSLWEVLQSKYVSDDSRNTQLQKHQAAIEKLKQRILGLIENVEIKAGTGIQQQLELKSAEINTGTFKGQNVSLWSLLYSKYITEEKRNELLEKYKSGTLTADEMLKVIITIIEETEKRSELKFMGLRQQVTASELLQSGIIDQKTLDDLTQGSKTVEEVTQMDSVKKYLGGSSSIAGVFVTSKTNPSQREKLTIYDAMLKRILRPGTALILLEAQAATGFVIDPIQNKKLSVEKALAAGLIGHDIYDKLLSAERGVTGYKDPYTGEKISLFQAMKKDLIVKDHGVRLLEAQIATGGIIDPVHSHRVPVEVAYKRGYFDEEMNQILSDPSDDTKGFFDPNTHENLTYLQLLQRCAQDPETGLYLLDVNVNKVPSTQTGKETILRTKHIRVQQTPMQDKNISIWEHLNSMFISTEKREELLKKYSSETVSVDELITIIIKLITGTIPLTTASADKETLLKSEKVDVSIGDFKEYASVWELLNSHYITEEKQREMLEKYNNGTLTIQEMIRILITTITESKTEGASQRSVISVQQQIQPEPSLQEDEIQKALQSINIHVRKGEYAGREVSVWDLLHSRYISDEKRQELLGNYKLTLKDIIQLVIQTIEYGDYRGIPSHVVIDCNLTDEMFSTVATTQIEVTEGEFKGQKYSVWTLLTSKYFSDEKRCELLEKFKSGAINIDELIKIITTIIQETEEHSKSLQFKGLRRQVSASELLSSKIIDQNTLRELAQGQKTVEEVTQMESVKRYLEGTSCIAGVLVPSPKDPSKKNKMSIYDAMLKNILRPGTALVLLEAQAATGFILDPVSNKKLSVDEAAAAGLIGQELHAKLLSAERAVTGYNDPYTSEKISLFQAIQKDLIVKDHGIRLLEAQIATGGIIDPVHSHRVPVEVAYKRGYFDKQMNQVLSDPTDDTKGFFDPNTHENLTYLQLLGRCVQEPDTGLYMLTMKDKQAALAEKTSLQSLTILIKVGQYKGQTVSSWELLYSKYFTEEKRQLLLNKYNSKTITVEEFISSIQSAIEEWEKQHSSQNVNGFSLEEAVHDITGENKKKSLLQSELVEITKGKLQGQKVSVWDLLNSEHIEVTKKEDILQKYFSGVLTLEEIVRIITVTINQATIPKPGETSIIATDELEKALNAIVVNIKTSQQQEQKISLWGALHSNYLPEDMRNDQLTKHKFIVENLKQTIASLIDESETNKDTEIQQALDVKLTEQPQKIQSVREIQQKLEKRLIEVSTGEFKGQNVCLWFLLHSKYITEEKRTELLEKYKKGSLTEEEFLRVIITIIKETEQAQQIQAEREIKQKLEVRLTEVNVGEFKGQNVSLWSLLYSKYITEEKRTELLQKYKLGSLTEEEFLRIIITIIEETEQSEKIKADKEVEKKLEVKLTEVSVGEFKGQNVSVWFLLHSKYVTEEKRRELLEKYASGTLTNEEILKIIITIIEETEQTQQIQAEREIQRKLELRLTEVNVGEFKGQNVSLWFLLYSKYITEEKRSELLQKYKLGSLTEEEFLRIIITIIEETEQTQQIQAEREIQRKLELRLTEVNVGEFKGQNVSLWFLLYSKYITEEKRTELLQKYKLGSLTEEEFLRIIITIIEETEQTQQIQAKKEIQQKLELKLNEVNVGEFKGQNVSLWFLLYSKYITEEKRIELLEKYKLGSLTEDEIFRIIITIIEETEHTQQIQAEREIQQKFELKFTKVNVGEFKGQNVSLWFLLYSKYITEEKRTELLKKFKLGSLTEEEIIRIIITIIEETEESLRIKREKEIQQELELKLTEVTVGEFKGQNVSVWFLLYSKYITEEKRNELLEKYKLRTLTADEILKIIITIIEETEKRRELKFKGLRRQVTASELHQSEIIDQKTLDELTQGNKTVEEVTQMDSVKKYLEGSSSIAGVFITSKTDPSKKEKLSIYNAMLKRILRPGTALILLEAQAATGYVIDPIQNKKLSVDEALAAGLIGHDVHGKLLSAERGVTGYNDPYTDGKISLFQAMKKDLIVKDHGIRLLEAQIATGGIIDPIHSHRVPVGVAYKRGYFDEEMNQILSDPSDDTKGFFDPNTHENLTYLQLIQRCVQDPETGLYMLDVKDASAIKEDLKIKSALQAKAVQISVGEFQGKNISVWDLLYSRYILVEKQQELLKKYRAGTLTIEELITILVTIITETDNTEKEEKLSPEIKAIRKSFLSVKIEISIGDFHEKAMSLWDLLHSKYIPEDKREELIEKFKSQTLTIEEIINIVLGLIQKTEMQSRKTMIVQEHTVLSVSDETSHWPSEDQLQKALKVIPSNLSRHPSEAGSISLWDFLHSQNLPAETRNMLLQTYKFSVREVMSVCTNIVKGNATEVSIAQSLESSSTSQESAQANKGAETQNLLQSVEVDVTVGQQPSKTYSLWDLLHSSYITGDTRNELIGGYETGASGLQDLMKRIMQLLMEAEKTSVQIASRQKVTLKTEQLSLESIPEPVTKSLQAFTVSISSSEFTGESIPLWDLLQSKSITKAMRLELLKKYFLTINGIIATLSGSSSKTVTVVSQKPDTATFLKSVRVQVNIGGFKLEGESHSLWELLHSEYITEEKRKELIQQYESGTITWEQIFEKITTIIKETEEKSRNIKFNA
ncbi:epiplakin [Rana temporaria]|uniref:epiplakin n=1 Tax=Rana temporaria TaxID=8407 RepID=UPI001AAC6E92|nr:epiplakin [Rana temporaria]